ncbi:MAG: hypothetical protein AAF581_21945 [Planctomycetota bacterium]
MTQSAFVIGPGEVGRRLGGALESQQWQVTTVRRNDGWDAATAATDGPRLLCMREEDIVAAFGRFSAQQRSSTVLVQNGFLEAGIPATDLAGTTRGLIWFTSKGDFYLPLRTSVLFGPWANALAEAFNQAGVPFEVSADESAFLRDMIIKGFWNTVVGLPLAVHGVDLGTYLADFGDEIEQLAHESVTACAPEYGVEVAVSDALSTLHETTTELGWVKTSAAKALDWRNGAVAAFGRKHGVPTPVNDRLLAAGS